MGGRVALPMFVVDSALRAAMLSDVGVILRARISRIVRLSAFWIAWLVLYYSRPSCHASDEPEEGEEDKDDTNVEFVKVVPRFACDESFPFVLRDGLLAWRWDTLMREHIGRYLQEVRQVLIRDGPEGSHRNCSGILNEGVSHAVDVPFRHGPKIEFVERSTSPMCRHQPLRVLVQDQGQMTFAEALIGEF